MKKHDQYKVDNWIFDPNENKIIVEGEEFFIDNRLSKLLLFLIKNEGVIYSRDQIINKVWQGAILTDQVVTQSIFELRKQLKQVSTENKSYIKTISKKGYKFEGEVDVVSGQNSTLKNTKLVKNLPAEVLSNNSNVAVKYSPSPSNKKWKIYKSLPLFLLVSAIIFGFALFGYDEYKQQTTPEEQYTLNPYLIEVHFDENIGQYELQRGIVELILRNLRKNTQHYYISAEINNNAAQRINITINGETSFKLKFIDKVSKTTKLDRTYTINSIDISSTSIQVSADLAKLFNINNNKRLLTPWVYNNKELSLIVQTYGRIVSGHFDQLIDTRNEIKQQIRLGNDTDTLVSLDYMLGILDLYMGENTKHKESIEELNKYFESYDFDADTFETNVAANEALAVYYLTKQNADGALIALRKHNHYQRSLMSTILLGKAYEMKGKKVVLQLFIMKRFIAT
ncbi:winged helix-turn-helix domain-containing protein [Vibrio sp. SS-MA-C1-2]|uniref:winged helix-turn-helix domain-containing protein n=1 Tax=Vibrio sp. SS-MA-C1-2 TaxID=2908646 RepID=UPI001F309B67|nr:winged helix-turn-helix domain-containing protein [Vibrio sp. SS-MA-C1-2]UJF17003.1 winged helix-turn-helix domain-containing protein [Vibrio sp. SS-MA-C1-2]